MKVVQALSILMVHLLARRLGRSYPVSILTIDENSILRAEDWMLDKAIATDHDSYNVNPGRS